MPAQDLPALFGEDRIESGDAVEYEGFNIIHQVNGHCMVQLEGHGGVVGTFEVQDFDGPLELVEHLNEYFFQSMKRHFAGDEDALVRWAGPILTRSETTADNNSETHMHIPGRDTLTDASKDETTVETDGGWSPSDDSEDDTSPSEFFEHP